MTLHDELLSIDTVVGYDPALGRFLTRLHDSLRADRFIDFSFMVRDVVNALGDGRAGNSPTVRLLRHLLVDEYQDVNPVQEALISALHQRSETLFVVGDDDQAIYEWRGADVTNIMTFSTRYPNATTHNLDVNYRCSTPIVASADTFAKSQLGPTRIAKTPQAAVNREPRDLRRLWLPDREQEANWIARRIATLVGAAYEEPDGSVRGLTYSDFAILMRSTRAAEQNNAARHGAYTSALNAAGIPFTMEAGGGVFDRPQVAALRDTFELLRDQAPTREQLEALYQTTILTAFPSASFEEIAQILAEWSRRIHVPAGAARQRLFPQALLHELLGAFGIAAAPPGDVVMRDIGLFSRMLQDVEAVYLSIDSRRRFSEMLNFLSNVAEGGYDTSTFDVVSRPNAVTVMTVHKAKGLEFPVVFVADVEAGRFPGRRSGYDGWLPRESIAHALQRGAYQSTPASEARLFYTAVTRAERFLYVTGAQRLPNARKDKRPSAFAQALQHSELATTVEGPFPVTIPATPRQRVEDNSFPTTFSQIRYYLNCPKQYQFRENYGFSPPIPEMFGYGRAVHATVGKLHEQFPDAAPSKEEAEALSDEIFHLKHVSPSADPETRPGPYEAARERARTIVGEYVARYENDFERERQVEKTFEIAAGQSVITGAIDLLLREADDGTVLDAQVVDFKAIEGGPNPTTNPNLDWTALALQVQLYAKAARVTLGADVELGSVHLLKDNQRVVVPVTDDAVDAATANVEWAVARILADDYPMRPHTVKCNACDFAKLCPKLRQDFREDAGVPPELKLPNGASMLVPAFSQVD
jgi:DNA helicase-2/ATP-dependent DNA helicase PcrA